MSSGNAWVIYIFVCLLECIKRKATQFQVDGYGALAVHPRPAR